jgi:hypothetical protein
MSRSATLEYLETLALRYRGAKDRIEKSRILDEICATCGFHRKHVIRILARRSEPRSRPRRRPGPKSAYTSPEILRPLRKIWLTANLPCSKRLKAMIPLWLPGYEALFGPLAPEGRDRLLAISASTIDRVLKHTRIMHTRHGRTTTKPGTLLRHQIPIATGQWQETRPGYLEADTVAHCGGSMAGEFAYTLDCVDIATGWTEQRAVWAKSEGSVVEQMRAIEKALPFPLLGFDSDNGSEFINHALVRHFLGRQRPVQFTRSRAYKKDDNAHIEQKNWTHVREWLGYERFDDPEAIRLMNELYSNEWRFFHNFYSPSVKLMSKERVGSKTKKTHDEAKTPYERVMASEAVSDYTKNTLKMIRENTNPFTLRKAIDQRIKKIFKLCYKHQVRAEPEEAVGNTSSESTNNPQNPAR